MCLLVCARRFSVLLLIFVFAALILLNQPLRRASRASLEGLFGAGGALAAAFDRALMAGSAWVKGSPVGTPAMVILGCLLGVAAGLVARADYRVLALSFEMI